MKTFLYKTSIITIVVFVIFQITIGSVTRKINKSLNNIQSKENIEKIKTKIRSEIKNSLKKEKILNDNDKILIKSFLNKIINEINN